MEFDRVRNRTAQWQQTVDQTGWPARLAVSFGLAGFLAVMATISFPLPWTPVPFSMAPFALLVVGAYQRPGWAVLSVAIYLLAGALGAPIYAEGASGWRYLVGGTAGYLFGYMALAAFASWYIQQRRRLLPIRWVAVVGACVGLLVVAGIASIVRFTTNTTGFEAYGYAGWNYSSSLLWVLGFVTVASAAVVAWSLLRTRGRGTQALNLYLVFLAGTGILHLMGVTGLVILGNMNIMTAIIAGSVVFLPFDIVKAGLAVAATLPFLPESHA